MAPDFLIGTPLEGDIIEWIDQGNNIYLKETPFATTHMALQRISASMVTNAPSELITCHR